MKLLALNSFLEQNFTKTLLFLFLSPIAMLSFGYYLQFYEGLEPCPLCSFQRGAFMLISFFSLISLIFLKVKFINVTGWFLNIISAIGGLLLAIRHIMLQNMDESDVPACGPDLAYMLDAFPIFDVLETVLTGSGSCAEVTWSFLYLSIPEWAALAFLFYIVIIGSVLHSKFR